MKEIMKQKLSGHFTLKERDVGEYARIDRSGMHFRISAYNVESGEGHLIGNLCVMDMRAMLGLMKMHTEVFTPLGVDAPMFSKDTIQVAGTTTLILEVYDTLTGEWSDKELEDVKKTGKYLPEYDSGIHWYDSMRFPCSSYKKGKKIQKQLDEYEEKYTEVYTDGLTKASAADPEKKREKTSAYVEQLIANGGPAVNQFRKMLGEDKTEEFLRKYMFASI